MRTLTRVCLVAMLLAAGVTGSALAAEPVSSEQLLPAKTLAFAKIPNAAQFRQKWGESSFGAMQNDPAFQEFFKDIERQIAGLTVGIDKSFGVGLKQLWLSLDGEVSVAVVHRPGEGLAFVALAEGDNATLDRLLAQLNERLAANGGVSATLNAGDTDVTSWSVGTGADVKKFSYYRDNGRLVVSNNLSALLDVAGRKGSSPGESFQANAAYQQIVKDTAPESGGPVLQWYADPVGLLEAGVSENLEHNPNRAMVLGLLPQAGLDKFKALGGSFELGAGAADNITRTAGYIEQPTGGLLQAFKMPATTQTPPTWVKDDVNLYGQINFSVPQVFQTVAGFYDKTQGEGSFNQLVGSAKLGDTEFTYSDLIDQLVGPIHVVAKVPSSTEALTTQPTVMAFGVRDPQKMQEMLDGLAKSAQLESSSVDGVTMYSMSMPSPVEGQKFAMGAAIAEGTLMFSTSSDYLKSVLAERNSKRPLADSQAYKQATAQFPSQTSMISFQKQDNGFEGLYEQIRSGKVELPMYGGVARGLGLDFSKLPSFSAMSRYMQTSSSYIEPTAHGFRMVSIAQPPGEQ